MTIWDDVKDFGSDVVDGAGSLLGGLNPKRKSNQPGIDEGNFDLSGANGRRNSLLQQADFAAGRGAPQVAGSGFRGDQGSLIHMLQEQAAGRGPSAAQEQLKHALGQNVSTQQALLASGGSARAAAQQASALGGSLAGQASQARVQEQLGAQGLLSQTLQGARGQDLQRALGQTDAELRSRGLNDQQIARLRELELRNAESQQRGRMGLEGERTARRGQDLGTPTVGEMAISAGSSILGAS